MKKKELVSLLEKHGVDVSLFGSGTTKSVNDLLMEIHQGETKLVEANGQLFRELSAVRVYVFADVKEGRVYLVEDRQVFDNGQIRIREKKNSVSEKMKEKENPHEVVKRGLLEELGVRKFKFIKKSYSLHTEIIQSPSYPEIISKYIFYDFAILLDDSEYKEEGYIEKQGNITTFFKWRRI